MRKWVFLIPLLFVTGCFHTTSTGVGEKISTSIASVTSTPVNSGVYEIDYTLSWIVPSGVRTSLDGWHLKPAELVYVQFWNGVTQLGSIPVSVGLPDEFLDRTIQTTTSKIYVNPPSNADAVSVILGKSNVVTDKVVLPPVVWL